MINSLSIFIGLRYTGSARRSQLLSFISAISITGLVLGVALLLVVLSVMNGFDRELRERILGIMPQAAIYHRHGIEDWQSLQQQVAQNPHVTASAPFVQLQGLASKGRQVAPLSVYGIDPQQEEKLSVISQYLPEQAFADLTKSSDGVLLGAGLAKTLGAELGDKITVIIPHRGSNSQPAIQILSVIAVFDTGTEVDHALALMNLAAASSLSDFPSRVSGLRLQVDELFSAPRIAYQLVRDLPYGFYGTDWTRTHGNLFQAIQMSKSLVGLLLFLIIGIAAFNVVSTLIMVVVDKQGDIAILRTLGASTREIMGVFMVQGSLIGIVGTTLGLILGAGLCTVVARFVTALETLFDIQFLKSDVYPISYLPVDLRLADVLFIGAVALLLTFLATLYPAWKASRVRPAEALRFE